jgi:hypothetical protein
MNLALHTDHQVPFIESRLLALVLCVVIASLVFGSMVQAAESEHDRQAAVWMPRKLQFVYMGFTTHYSCDGLRDNMRSVLLQLGAREKDLKLQPYGCTRTFGKPEPFPGIDATFFVLAPTRPGAGTGVPTVEAEWKSVDLKLGRNNLEQAGQCELLEQIRQKILPLFTARNLDFRDDCIPHQLTAGRPTLRVEVLEPVQAPTAALLSPFDARAAMHADARPGLSQLPPAARA